MASSPVHIVAILTPLPGKYQELDIGLQTMIKNVWEKEPTTSRYHMHKQVGQSADDEPMICMVETYDSKSDADAHVTSPYFQEFAKQVQGLLKEAPKIVQCVSVAGFESREQGLL